jgi:hypothetical protein
MKFKTNFSEEATRTQSFDPIPPGIYQASVFGVFPSKASTGTEYLNIEFEILGPSHQGRHIWANIYLTDKAGWKLSAFCHAVGVEPCSEMDTSDFLGRPLLIVVKEIESADGNPRTEAAGFRKLKKADVPF